MGERGWTVPKCSHPIAMPGESYLLSGMAGDLSDAGGRVEP